MSLQYRAAVLHAAQTPMAIETVTAAPLKPTDVLVRIRAAGLGQDDIVHLLLDRGANIEEFFQPDLGGRGKSRHPALDRRGCGKRQVSAR